MANKNTLAKSKIDEFKLFVEYLGYKTQIKNLPAFQVLRFKIPNAPMAIIFNGRSPVHYTANESAIPFVSKFIRSIKNDN